MADRDGAVMRRRLLASIAAGTGVGIAGCLNGDEPGDESDEDDEHRYATTLRHPGDEPIEFTDDQNCPVCAMTPRDYPHWRSQLAHENGAGAAFDTPGCLFAYYAAPPTDSPVVGAWVSEFGRNALIDATEAHYVLVTDDNAVYGETMGLNPRPFADREDAVAYLDEWDAEDLTENDIIELVDVDRDVAAIYRSGRLPDEPDH
ncbi:nitrous oxide reductase accessory protein NosL [Halopiger djelfimassiliensis]|uniref:nitrous oxide reductase accessory protein NosL n=1 Tax=Halopiger djelfimassiliensis TaxID=1293047 RepID=UPI000677CAC4|nr:nitrous oxide reductase accessory protein NosL [Halopiger djelfimassiliensis]